MITKLNIQPITKPKIRSPTKRFIGNVTTAHTPTTPEEHYRADFFKVLDTEGEVWSGWSENTAVVDQYPEFKPKVTEGAAEHV